MCEYTLCYVRNCAVPVLVFILLGRGCVVVSCFSLLDPYLNRLEPSEVNNRPYEEAEDAAAAQTADQADSGRGEGCGDSRRRRTLAGTRC